MGASRKTDASQKLIWYKNASYRCVQNARPHFELALRRIFISYKLLRGCLLQALQISWRICGFSKHYEFQKIEVQIWYSRGCLKNHSRNLHTSTPHLPHLFDLICFIKSQNHSPEILPRCDLGARFECERVERASKPPRLKSHLGSISGLWFVCLSQPQSKR